MNSMLEYESKLWNQYDLVAGLDEAGRGAWAGPVVAAAVIFKKDVAIPGINDSKKLTPKKRDLLFDVIKSSCVCFGVGLIGADIIDDINILEASKKAMLQAVKQMTPKPEYLLVDGNMTLETDIPQNWIIEGDSKSHSIAAASILAKVTRDRLMVQMAVDHPGYGFEKHKGYGTKIHQQALKDHGVLVEHRKSYKPVARLI